MRLKQNILYNTFSVMKAISLKNNIYSSGLVMFMLAGDFLRTSCSSSSIHLDSGTLTAHSGGFIVDSPSETADMTDLICS